LSKRSGKHSVNEDRDQDDAIQRDFNVMLFHVNGEYYVVSEYGRCGGSSICWVRKCSESAAELMSVFNRVHDVDRWSGFTTGNTEDGQYALVDDRWERV